MFYLPAMNGPCKTGLRNWRTDARSWKIIYDMATGLSCIHVSFCQPLHASAITFVSHRFPFQTLGFLNLAVLVTDFTTYFLTHLGHPPPWLIADFLQRRMAFLPPLPCTLPNLLTIKKCLCSTWVGIYHILDKMQALCHHFWLRRCPRLGKFLRYTWWLGKESPDRWKTSAKVPFLLIFPKLHQCSQLIWTYQPCWLPANESALWLSRASDGF